MVRVYKKKTNKLNWTDGQLNLAIQNVRNGKTCKAAAEQFGVPRATLQKKIKELDSAQDENKCNKGILFNNIIFTILLYSFVKYYIIIIIYYLLCILRIPHCQNVYFRSWI